MFFVRLPKGKQENWIFNLVSPRNTWTEHQPQFGNLMACNGIEWDNTQQATPPVKSPHTKVYHGKYSIQMDCSNFYDLKLL